MLSGSTLVVAPMAPSILPAAQTASVTSPRVSSSLSKIYQQYLSYTHTTAYKHGKPFVPAVGTSIPLKGNKVGVIAHAAAGKFNSTVSALRAMGMTVKSSSAQYGDIAGFLPPSAIAKAGRLAGLLSLTPMIRPIVNTSGTVPNQADTTMNVQLARSLYGLDGSGVKIGVISDSVAVADPTGFTADEQDGELPPNVEIVRNSSGVLQDGQDSSTDTDEGRAMLELIHDLAPRSPLAFATGDSDVVNMTNNIRLLLSAGCKVIVDDLGYQYEPMFQDGLISQAINDVYAAGATYVSAVGNDGMGGYERTTQFVTGPLTLPDGGNASGTFVNFAPAPAPADTQLQFNDSEFGDLVFQWDNPWDGNTGVVSADMDIFLYKLNTSTQKYQFFASSADNNSNSSGTGQPMETIFGVLPGTYRLLVRLNQSAQTPTMFGLVLSNGQGTGISNFDYPGQIGSAYGHSAGANTISVGAVNASGTLTTNEAFSSSGPVTYLFDANGNRLASPLTLNKPDVSGVDHVTTSFFGDPGGPNGTFFFNGTSAAAPNVAAVAALIYQYEPWAREPQILAAMESTASPLNGAALGAWDPQGGYGLVNGAKALSTLDITPPVAQVAPILTSAGAPDSAVISFSEAVFGLTLSDLTLTLKCGPNLLTADQTLSVSEDHSTYTIGNLSGLTSDAGTYALSVHADSNVTDYNGRNVLASGASASWNSDGSAAVLARYTFYNDSAFDNSDPNANLADDGAIAIDKTALLPGQTADFVNYTSYINGINGIMIDVARLPAGYTPQPSDFAFMMGNSSDPTTWIGAPAPSGMTLLAGAGVGGSDRIDIVWDNQAIMNQWLQVTMLASVQTGLDAPDVFYFGNAVGDTGNSATDATVSVNDVLGARGRQSINSVFIYNRWDFNRNGVIDNADVLAARGNQNSATTALQLIAAPPPPPPATIKPGITTAPVIAITTGASGTRPLRRTPHRPAHYPPARRGHNAASRNAAAQFPLALLFGDVVINKWIR
jgi:hypothetical protein